MVQDIVLQKIPEIINLSSQNPSVHTLVKSVFFPKFWENHNFHCQHIFPFCQKKKKSQKFGKNTDCISTFPMIFPSVLNRFCEFLKFEIQCSEFGQKLVLSAIAQAQNNAAIC